MQCHAVIQQVPRKGGGGESRTGSTVGLTEGVQTRVLIHTPTLLPASSL